MTLVLMTLLEDTVELILYTSAVYMEHMAFPAKPYSEDHGLNAN